MHTSARFVRFGLIAPDFIPAPACKARFPFFDQMQSFMGFRFWKRYVKPHENLDILDVIFQKAAFPALVVNRENLYSGITH
ncbi:MAG: hypothetical protein WAU86_13380 [Oricola sp.]